MHFSGLSDPQLLSPAFFAEGAFSQAFIPVLSEYKSRGRQDEVKELIDRTTGTLGLFFC